MQKKKINNTTYAVEKLKATEGFKLQLKVVKLLGGGIFDALQGNDLAKIGEMKTDKLFESLAKFIEKTDDEDVSNFVFSLLEKNVFIVGKANNEEVNIPLDIDAHMDDKLLDIFKVAIFVLEVNLKKSLGGLKSLMPSLQVKQNKGI